VICCSIVNNIYVHMHESRFESHEYSGGDLDDRVKEYNLAGYERAGILSLSIYPWKAGVQAWLWGYTSGPWETLWPRCHLIEWDTDIPSFDVLQGGKAHRKPAMPMPNAVPTT